MGDDRKDELRRLDLRAIRVQGVIHRNMLPSLITLFSLGISIQNQYLLILPMLFSIEFYLYCKEYVPKYDSVVLDFSVLWLGVAVIFALACLAV